MKLLLSCLEYFVTYMMLVNKMYVCVIFKIEYLKSECNICVLTYLKSSSS